MYYVIGISINFMIVEEILRVYKKRDTCNISRIDYNQKNTVQENWTVYQIEN